MGVGTKDRPLARTPSSAAEGEYSLANTFTLLGTFDSLGVGREGALVNSWAGSRPGGREEGRASGRGGSAEVGVREPR